MPDTYYHVGYPPDATDVFKRIRSGLPVYWPKEPKDIDQTPYIRFSERDKTPAYQQEQAR